MNVRMLKNYLPVHKKTNNETYSGQRHVIHSLTINYMKCTVDGNIPTFFISQLSYNINSKLSLIITNVYLRMFSGQEPKF